MIKAASLVSFTVEVVLTITTGLNDIGDAGASSIQTSSGSSSGGVLIERMKMPSNAEDKNASLTT